MGEPHKFSIPDFSNPPPYHPSPLMSPTSEYCSPALQLLGPQQEVRMRPPPLFIPRSENWEDEHYAGCYACQSKGSTPHLCLNLPPPTPGNSEQVPDDTNFIMPLFPMGTPTLHPIPTPLPPVIILSPLLNPLVPSPVTPLLPIPPGFGPNPLTPTLIFQYPNLVTPSPVPLAEPAFVFPEPQENGED